MLLIVRVFILKKVSCSIVFGRARSKRNALRVMASSLTAHFKAALEKTADRLTEDNIRELATFGESIPPARLDNIIGGMDLFDQLQEHDLLHENNVNNLITWLDELNLHAASEPLVEYRENYLQRKRRPKEKCPDHQGEIVIQFCITCNSKICQKCFNRSHKEIFGCEVIDLESMSREIDSRREKLREELKTLRQCCESTNNLWTQKKQEISQYYEKVRKQISEDKTLSHERTNTCASEILESITAYEKSTSENLYMEEEHIDDILAAINNIRELYTKHNDDTTSHLRKIYGSRKKVGHFRQGIQDLQEHWRNKFSGRSYRKMSEDCKFGDLRLSSLIGSVAVGKRLIVHLFDERQTSGGVCLVSIDSNNPKKENWRHLVPIDEKRFHVVMSYITLASAFGVNDLSLYVSFLDPLKGGIFNVLFAVGKRVCIVQVQTSSAQLIAPLDLDDIQDNCYITSICSSDNLKDPMGSFFISVSHSAIIREYRVTGEPLNIIDTKGWVSSVRCVATVEGSFAIIDFNKDDIILVKSGETVTRVGSLRPPSSFAGFSPICIIWTGALWLVLYQNYGLKREWKVVTYYKEGDFNQVNKAGTSKDNGNCPLGITRYGNTGFLSFENKEVSVFTH